MNIGANVLRLATLAISASALSVGSAPCGAQTVTGTNPTIPAKAYGQPSDPTGSVTNFRQHYSWDGNHSVPWFGETIEIDEEGSGVAAGPARAAYGLGINVTKRNWTASSIAGEIDGASVFGRNGVGDIAGFLVNVGTRQGFSALLEGSSYSFDASGNVVRGVRSLVGVNHPNSTGGDGSERGFATLADQGELDAAFFAGRNGGTWKDFLRNELTTGTAVTRFSGNGTQYEFGSYLGGEDVRATLGLNRLGSGNSYIDLFSSSDDASAGYGLRILRGNGGSSLVHRGQSQFSINAENGSVALQANSANLLIAFGTVVQLPQGLLNIAETQATAVPTPSSGSQVLFIDAVDHKLKRKNSAGVVTIIG